MSSNLIAEKILRARSVHVYKINEDGSRGDECSVTEWNECDFSDFDLSAFRVISGNDFEIWYDELADAVLEGNSFRVKTLEVVIESGE